MKYPGGEMAGWNIWVRRLGTVIKHTTWSSLSLNFKHNFWLDFPKNYISNVCSETNKHNRAFHDVSTSMNNTWCPIHSKGPKESSESWFSELGTGSLRLQKPEIRHYTLIELSVVHVQQLDSFLIISYSIFKGFLSVESVQPKLNGYVT